MLEAATAVAFGVASPAVIVLFAALGVIEIGVAFTLAKWSGFVLIGFYGYWAARFAGAPVPQALARGGLVALIGALSCSRPRCTSSGAGTGHVADRAWAVRALPDRVRGRNAEFIRRG